MPGGELSINNTQAWNFGQEKSKSNVTTDPYTDMYSGKPQGYIQNSDLPPGVSFTGEISKVYSDIPPGMSSTPNGQDIYGAVFKATNNKPLSGFVETVYEVPFFNEAAKVVPGIMANQNDPVAAAGSLYEGFNRMITPYTTDKFGMWKGLGETRNFGNTIPGGDVIDFSKTVAVTIARRPADIALWYGAGEAFGLLEYGGKVLTAKAAMSNTPVISTLGRVASTPYAADLYTTVKLGTGGYFAAESVQSIYDQPTLTGKAELTGKTITQFVGFGLGMSNIILPEPNNIHAGKTFFGKVPAKSPLTQLTESTVVKLGQAELYIRGKSEEARLLGDAFAIHKATRNIQPYDITGKVDLWDLTDVPFEHRVEIDKKLVRVPHALYGSGVEAAQSLPIEKMPPGSIGITPSSDWDIMANEQQMLGELADIPGAFVHKIKVPSVNGGMEMRITGVDYGGYHFAADLHNIPLDFMKLPGETLPRVAGTYSPEYKDLLAFKYLADPFAINPKTWQVTKPGDAGYTDTKLYVHSDVQQYRLMDALRKNVLTADSTDPVTGRGVRVDKDTIHLMSRFEDSIQTERGRSVSIKKMAELNKAETRLGRMKDRVITYTPDKNIGRMEVRVGDLQTIASENLDYGLSISGKPLKTPKGLGDIQSLKDYPNTRTGTKTRVSNWLEKTGQTPGKSQRPKSLSDYTVNRGTTSDRVKAFLDKTEGKSAPTPPLKTITIRSPASPKNMFTLSGATLSGGLGRLPYTKTSPATKTTKSISPKTLKYPDFREKYGGITSPKITESSPKGRAYTGKSPFSAPSSSGRSELYTNYTRSPPSKIYSPLSFGSPLIMGGGGGGRGNNRGLTKWMNRNLVGAEFLLGSGKKSKKKLWF
jgi:hypothetical protein